ncbi:uncharacterized protein LALA0_S01e15368g [Lachancea lanzarotensis]|uniref:LALA0S01e15368g1_1 n=1 Tax=Lachancea lanzarotensis TaxID=1245769 RepID=A0A0C7MLE6_9SACH|nr:uncharacterized protein LALA0_S01e15368g [Lachancea lanzarotensis]CEP60630.1 LALA0S01e15368g1_1 [Lachancea lanzarotensis]
MHYCTTTLINIIQRSSQLTMSNNKDNLDNQDNQERKKFYLDRAGKRAEVNIEHLRKPHTFEPVKRSVGENLSSPLTLGGDHRPTADLKGKEPFKKKET